MTNEGNCRDLLLLWRIKLSHVILLVKSNVKYLLKHTKGTVLLHLNSDGATGIHNEMHSLRCELP